MAQRQYPARDMPYRPSGNKSYAASAPRETIPDNVMGFVHTWAISARLAHITGGRDVAGLTDETIVLSFMRNDNRKALMHVALTDLTTAEHSALRDFLNMALDTTEPIVKARDKAGRDAWEIDGDDSNYREHRSAPQLVVRDRALFEHATGCVERSAYVPRSQRDQSDSDGPDRIDGFDVAEVAAPSEGPGDSPEIPS